MSVPRAVLWDMDGTLIDSEQLHWLAWRDTLKNEGVSITYEQFLAAFGRRDDAFLPEWLGSAASLDRIEQIGETKEELYRDLVRKKGMLPLPGAETWVRRLHEEGWLQAIASAAPRPNIDVVLEAFGAAGFFQGIVSAEDVHRGKPDPEVFLIAASRVGVLPERCIVVEDAVAGVQGARFAGMRSIGVSHNGNQLPADLVVKSLDLLPPDSFDKLLRDAKATASLR